MLMLRIAYAIAGCESQGGYLEVASAIEHRGRESVVGLHIVREA